MKLARNDETRAELTGAPDRVDAIRDLLKHAALAAWLALAVLHAADELELDAAFPRSPSASRSQVAPTWASGGNGYVPEAVNGRVGGVCWRMQSLSAFTVHFPAGALRVRLRPVQRPSGSSQMSWLRPSG